MHTDGPGPARPRLRDRVLVALFLVVLSAPMAALIMGARPGDYLNKTLAEPPDLTLGAVSDTTYFVGLDDFIDENFPVRPQAIEARAAFELWLLSNSPNPRVVVGRDGWLFFDTTLEPECPSTAEEVLAQVDSLASSFAALGRDFRFTVAPDKRSIYPDRLPSSAAEATTCTDLQRPDLRAGMAARPENTVDLWGPVLRQAELQPDEPVYRPHDTHWNPYGAAAAIGSIVESVSPGVWSREDIDPGPGYEVVGGLSRMLGLINTELVPGLTSDRADGDAGPVTSTTTLAPRVKRMVTTGGAPTVQGRTLIVGDSFFGGVLDHFAPWFADIIYVPVQRIGCHDALAVIDEVDRVILERVERVAYGAGPESGVDYEALMAPLLAHLAGEPLPPESDSCTVAEE